MLIENSQRRNSRLWKNSPYDAKQKSKLYHCYISGDVFKNATATKVQGFDGSGIKELVAVDYIQFAIRILKTKKDRVHLKLSHYRDVVQVVSSVELVIAIRHGRKI